jgi:CheY-like chemotaxis protein
MAFGACMATRVAELFQPTLVLLDLEVLNASGHQLVQALRALGGPLSHALFVCLASKENGQQAQRWLAAGCDHVVCKPLQSHLLADLLAQAQAQREVQCFRVKKGGGQTPRTSGADSRREGA